MSWRGMSCHFYRLYLDKCILGNSEDLIRLLPWSSCSGLHCFPTIRYHVLMDLTKIQDEKRSFQKWFKWSNLFSKSRIMSYHHNLQKSFCKEWFGHRQTFKSEANLDNIQTQLGLKI